MNDKNVFTLKEPILGLKNTSLRRLCTTSRKFPGPYFSKKDIVSIVRMSNRNQMEHIPQRTLEKNVGAISTDP